jgi:hypothetical protein
MAPGFFYRGSNTPTVETKYIVAAIAAVGIVVLVGLVIALLLVATMVLGIGL